MRRLLLYTTVALVCAAVLFPVYWMLTLSVRPTRDTISYPPTLWPREIEWNAYAEAFRTLPIVSWLSNTFLVSVGVTLICLALSISDLGVANAPRLG